jgi:hypothetical protein
MSIIHEVIRTETDGSLSFGDYLSAEKKKADLKWEGNEYHIKTHSQITRLEKNGMLLLEVVPGAAVHHMSAAHDAASFDLSGQEDTRITLELEPDTLYQVIINGNSIGNVKSNLSGKVIFSMELDDTRQNVQVKKA